MNRNRFLFALRCLISSVFLLLVLLLIALWVRSTSTRDIAMGVIGNKAIYLFSLRGELTIAVDGWQYDPFSWQLQNDSVSEEMSDVFPDVSGKPPLSYLGIRGEFSSRMAILGIPHGLLLPLFVLFAAAPWFSWRFSIRTLLILTTLAVLFIVAALTSFRST